MVSRLLCCSDTHGARPAPCDESTAIAWLHAGDRCLGAEAADFYSPDDPRLDPLLAPVADWFATRQLPVFFVDGNHDVVDLYHAGRWGKNISSDVVRLTERLVVVGVGWHGERYFELPYESHLRVCCDAVMDRASSVIGSSDRLVLLTHYPPRLVGTHDVPGDVDGGGIWYDCVRELIDQLPVTAVVQGHVHKWFGAVHRVPVGTRNVLVVNPGPAGCIVDVDNESGIAEHRLFPAS